MRRKKLIIAWVAVCLAAVVGVEAHSLLTDRGTPSPREGYFPDIVLTTHEGKQVHFYEDVVKGDKIVMLNFMYVDCAGVCPGVTQNLVRVQRMLGSRMGKDVFIYAITLNPDVDTPEVLAEYAKSYRVGKGFTFLTGKFEDTERLRHILGFEEPDPEKDRVRSNHAGLVMMANESLDRWMACPGNSNPERIMEQLLLLESPRMQKTRNYSVERGGI